MTDSAESIRLSDITSTGGGRVASTLLVILLALIIFLPSLGGGFVNWDDNQLLENTAWRGGGWKNIVWWFTGFAGGDFKPLVWASYALDYAFWKFNPAGYHAGNILLHALNTVLLYLLLLKLNRFRSVPMAVLAALFFSLHPLRVESVCWISERKDVLFAFFYLLSVMFYIDFARGRASPFPAKGRRSSYFLSLVCGVLSLLSKPMAVSLPFVLLVLDFYPLKRLRLNPPRVLLEKVPYLIPALLVSLIALGAQARSRVLLPLADIGFGTRVCLAGRSCFFYLLKTLYPFGLRPLYPLGGISRHCLSAGAVAGILVIFGALIFLRRKKGITWPLVSWSIYLVTLAPVSGILPTGKVWLADRFSYLPALAISAVLYCVFCTVKEKTASYLRPLCWAALFSLSLLTLSQQRIWKDSIALWETVLIYHPASPTAHDHLGNALFRRGKYARASVHHSLALKVKPDDPDINYNLALALAARGELEASVFYYRRALEIEPDHRRALINLGNAFLAEDRFEEALECYRRVIELDCGHAGAHLNSGVALFRQGKYDEAIEYFSRALELKPDMQSARIYLQRAKEKAGK